MTFVLRVWEVNTAARIASQIEGHGAEWLVVDEARKESSGSDGYDKQAELATTLYRTRSLELDKNIAAQQTHCS